MREGDLIIDEALGRGMVVYMEEGEAVCAFPFNPEFVLCDEGGLEFLINISEVK